MKIAPTRRRFIATAAALAALPSFVLAGRAAAETTASAQALRAALAHVARGRWAEADAAVRAGGGPVAIDIVRWHWLRAGEGRLGDYEDFLARRADWPGLDLLRRKGEEAVARSREPARVIAYFSAGAPQTAIGTIAHVEALLAEGRRDEAVAVAVAAWKRLAFTPGEAAALQAALPGTLEAHHPARLDHLIWEERTDEARGMLGRVGDGPRRLAEARIALLDDADGVDGLIASVPEALAADPGLARARAGWRLRKGRNRDAATLMIERSADPAALGRPEAWAGIRARLVRALLREGADETAYRVAANHHLTSGGDFADLEFLAGFSALRRLGDAERALGHFRHLATRVATPISLSRALYWQGRAEEAAGRGAAATEAYAQAARHQSAYYGLLAAERIGATLDPALVRPPALPDWRGAPFLARDVAEAGLLARAAGNAQLGRRFVLHMAEGFDAPDLGRLAAFALAQDWPNLAVLAAKRAAETGSIYPAAYFPVPDMVPEGLSVSRALALAIARRESEFDPEAVSPAGARGLMQVMPETARMMAGALSLPFDEDRLTSDASYNARLGAAYLERLIDEFGPSIALVAAGYNAGPGRPRAWLREFGDPRAADTDIVDWVEAVPFTETRTYIMRVAEARVIYGARLRGEGGAVAISRVLSGRPA
jgi:soluble lytic murein transglycosylase